MNKLVINHLQKIFVTTDTATIMREMEVRSRRSFVRAFRTRRPCAHVGLLLECQF
jgi:hypothetical protein